MGVTGAREGASGIDTVRSLGSTEVQDRRRVPTELSVKSKAADRVERRGHGKGSGHATRSAGNRELRQPRTRADGDACHGEQSEPFAAGGRSHCSARLVGRRKPGRGTRGWLFWAARRHVAREECDTQPPRRLQDSHYALPTFAFSVNQATPPRGTGSGAPRAGLSLGARPARLRHPGPWRRCWSDWLIQAACGQSVGTCDEPMPAPLARTAARPGPGITR